MGSRVQEEQPSQEQVRRQSIPEHATLVGGPFDGKEVEIIGIRWEHYVADKASDPPRLWRKAVYTWDVDGDKYIGKFVGLFPMG